MRQQIKLHITDERMLQFMDYCTANKLNDVTTMKSWCERIGISSNNIFNIRNGLQQFGKDHILNACVEFNVSADFFFGFTNEMSRVKKNLSPIDRIKEAVNELEQEQKSKRDKVKYATGRGLSKLKSDKK